MSFQDLSVKVDGYDGGFHVEGDLARHGCVKSKVGRNKVGFAIAKIRPFPIWVSQLGFPNFIVERRAEGVLMGSA